MTASPEKNDDKRAYPIKVVVRRLFGYVIPYMGWFILSLVGLVVHAGAEVAALEWLKQVTDYITSPREAERFTLVFALVAIAVTRGLGNFVSGYASAQVSSRLGHAMRQHIFDKMMLLPMRFYDRNSGGHLVSLVIFISGRVVHASTTGIQVLFRESVLMLGLMGYMLYLNWELSLMVFIAGPLIAWIINVMSRRLRRINRHIQIAMGDLTQVTGESIRGQELVKSLSTQDYESERFGRASNNVRRQQMKVAIVNAMAMPLVLIILSLMLAYVVVAALDPETLATTSPGTFVAFIGATGALSGPARKLLAINPSIQSAIVAAQDIFQHLDRAEEGGGQHRVERVRGEIELRDLRFRYEEDDAEVLRGINCRVEAGQTVALVGASGEGKSTLANLLPKFYTGYSGQILLDGVPLEAYNLADLRRQIALVSQRVVMLNAKVVDNICYGRPDATPEEIERAARLSNAWEFIEKLPAGLDTLVGDDGVLLSGGQRQRIAIARALLRDAPILVLDEATSSLDSASEKQVQEGLENLMGRQTTLVIAHRLSTIENADVILVLDKGQVCERGDHRSLLKANGLYAQFYHAQFSSTRSSPSPPAVSPPPSPPSAPVVELPPLFDTVAPDGLVGSVDSARLATSSTVGPRPRERAASVFETLWYRRTPWSFLLWPLSLLYGGIVMYRRYYAQRSRMWQAPVPVVVVGNLTVGGTGKTPVVIALARSLAARGYRPGIVSRGYGGWSDGKVQVVTVDSDPAKCGDEPVLLASRTGCPVLVAPDRVAAASMLIETFDCDLIISDDGLQHYALGRDVEIAVLDSARGLGNRMLLPAGPLREPIGRLREMDLVIHNGGAPADLDGGRHISAELRPMHWVHLGSGGIYEVDNWPLGRQVHAVAGIGNPERFFATLEALGFDVIPHSFMDHHSYRAGELEFDDELPVVMTEKDAVKCRTFGDDHHWALAVEMVFAREPVELLTAKLSAAKSARGGKGGQ